MRRSGDWIILPGDVVRYNGKGEVVRVLRKVNGRLVVIQK